MFTARYELSIYTQFRLLRVTKVFLIPPRILQPITSAPSSFSGDKLAADCIKLVTAGKQVGQRHSHEIFRTLRVDVGSLEWRRRWNAEGSYILLQMYTRIPYFTHVLFPILSVLPLYSLQIYNTSSFTSCRCWV
jgi:hypothetical protein